MRPTSASIIALILAPLLLSASRLQAAPRYTVTDLGVLADNEYSEGVGINESGQVVGYSARAGNSQGQAVLFENGTVQLLGNLGGGAGGTFVPSAHDINNNGQIVGLAFTSGGDYRAFLHSDGVMTDLGTLGGSTSMAQAINDAGEVTGTSRLAGNAVAHAFYYSDGVMHDLGTLNGGHSGGIGINRHGDIVGLSGSKAFLYSDGVMNDLGLGVAYDINDHGMIVGSDYDAVAQFYVDGAWHGLGTFGGRFSEALAVNNRGQVVGYAHDAEGRERAFLYEDGVLHDLNSLIDPDAGWDLRMARDINDKGQITGWGNGRAFLLTPISATPSPEPSSMAMLGVGLVGLMWWGRRRLGRHAARQAVG